MRPGEQLPRAELWRRSTLPAPPPGTLDTEPMPGGHPRASDPEPRKDGASSRGRRGGEGKASAPLTSSGAHSRGGSHCTRIKWEHQLT